MGGVIQRDEALGMVRGQEDLRGILDSDNFVDRRVQNQQGAAQVFDTRPTE